MKIYNRYTNEIIIEVKDSKTDLRGVNLTEAALSEADLSGADLSKADLFGANLEGADLEGASLLKRMKFEFECKNCGLVFNAEPDFQKRGAVFCENECGSFAFMTEKGTLDFLAFNTFVAEKEARDLMNELCTRCGTAAQAKKRIKLIEKRVEEARREK